MDNYSGVVAPNFRKAVLNAITGRTKLSIGNVYLGINVDPTGPLANSNGDVCNVRRPSVQGYEHALVGVPAEPLTCKFGAPTYNSATGKTSVTNTEEIHFKFNPNMWEECRPLEWLLEKSDSTILAWGCIHTSEYYGETNPPPANNIICIPKGQITISL